MIGKQDQNYRHCERHRGEDSAPPQHGANAQAPLQVLDIGVQVVPSVHGSSRDMVKY